MYGSWFRWLWDIGPDNLANSSRESLRRVERITGRTLTFVEGDVRDGALLDRLFAEHDIGAVIHFAGLKAVGESVAEPLRYYDCNVGGSLCLFEAMDRAGVRTLVFSSSATVYGDPATVPMWNPQNPPWYTMGPAIRTSA